MMSLILVVLLAFALFSMNGMLFGGNNPRVAFVGDAAWDLNVPVTLSTLTNLDDKSESPMNQKGIPFLDGGGGAANAAIWCRRCKTPCIFIGKIGKDNFGDLTVSTFEKEMVESALIRDETLATKTVAMLFDNENPSKKMLLRIFDDGADTALKAVELPLMSALSRNSLKHLHVVGWLLFKPQSLEATKSAVEHAIKKKMTISCDVSSGELIKIFGVDEFVNLLKSFQLKVLLGDVSEGRVIAKLGDQTTTEQVTVAVSQLFPGSIVVMTDGGSATVVSKGESWSPLTVSKYTPPEASSSTIHTTGAGDAFAGAFLSHFVEKNKADDATRFAVKIAGWKVTKKGTRPLLSDETIKSIINGKFA